MTGGTAKLVKTTYPFSDSSKAVNLYIYYKTTQDIANNRSTISCGMYVTTPSGWDIGQWDDFTAGSYLGTTSNTFDGTVPNFSGTRWIAENKTFTVNHNADGTGSATIQWKWNVNSPWGGYVYPSGSFTISLPTIARVSTPTLSASSVQMGKSVTITTNRASSSFTHTLKYTLNGTTATIATGVGASYTWTVPDLVSLVPNATSGTATITCETYSGSTKVGSKTVSLKITVYSATTPTLSASSVRMGSVLTITLPRATSKYTHKLSYAMGDTTGNIGVTATSYDWTVPTSLASKLTNATVGSVTITCVTYNGTATVGTTTAKFTAIVPGATVPEIPSGAQMMGSAVRISLPRAVDGYTHKLTYSMGNASGTIVESIGNAYSWIIPLSLAKEIPSAVSGTVNVTCVTMNGTATVGTETVTMSVSVPDNDTTKPTFTAVLKPSHSLPVMFSDLYVEGKAAVSVTFTAQSEYSNIKSYAVKIGSAEKSSTTSKVTSATITTSGSVPVTLTVTDARGFVRSSVENITVYPYANPKIAPIEGESALICARSTEGGTLSNKGEYALIKARAYYNTVGGKNTCRMSYRYKEASASSYTMSWVRLSGTEIASALSDMFDTKTAYTIQLYAFDDVGGKGYATFSLPALRTPIHMGEGGRNLGLGQFCDYSEEDRIDIGWKTYFNEGIANIVIWKDASGVGVVDGDYLTDAFAERVMSYTLFIAILKSGSSSHPVLCMRMGSKIYGSTDSLKLGYASSGNTLRLETIANAQTITALYALL